MKPNNRNMMTMLLEKRCARLKRHIDSLKVYSESKIQIFNGKYLKFILSDRSGRHYIRKDMVRKVAGPVIQLEYCRKQLETDQKMIEAIENLEKLQNMDVPGTFDPVRRQLITPEPLLKDGELLDWVVEVLGLKGLRVDPYHYHPSNHPFKTRRGEKVRSKSELIIADMMLEKGYRYFYELPVYIGGSLRYPDFTVVNMRTGEVLLYEHFGMMDSESYRDGLFAKLKAYEMAGLKQGRDYVATFEDARHPLDTAGLEAFMAANFS